MTATSSQAADLRAMVAQIARSVARDEIATALKNLRPGGLIPYACTVIDPIGSSVEPICHIDVPFPGWVEKVTFRSAQVGTATLDITKRRPTQTYAQALTIFTAPKPAIAGATDAEIPALPSYTWLRWIEADSTLYYFLTSVSGFTSLTINLWLRATSTAE
jgi:hypothetical protein